ncbi:MAG: hypothetical protein ACJ76P_05120 [Actinomycetota bacterium]
MRTFRVAFLVLSFVLVQTASALPALASAGDLDTSFSHDGLVLRKDIPGSIYSAVVQPDGKIVAAGVALGVDQPFRVMVARFFPDGSLDRTFGVNGVVRTRFNGGAYAWSVALAPDGDIVAGGSLTPPDGVGPTRFMIVRYLPNGSLDPAFSSDGKVHTHFGTGDASLYDLAVQPDGKVVAVGYTCCAVRTFAVARYLTDGSLDPGFGDHGKRMTAFTGSAGASGVALQADGKIVVVGMREVEGRRAAQGAVARYLSDGSLDATFGGDGRAITHGRSFGGEDVALASDGGVMISGSLYALPTTTNTAAITRFTPEGVFDTSFGVDGFAGADISGGSDGNAIAVQPDGRIVMAATPWTGYRFLATRWNSDGTPDTGFGEDGVAGVQFPSGRCLADSIVLTTDGGVVLGGWAEVNGDGHAALAKFLGS